METPEELAAIRRAKLLDELKETPPTIDHDELAVALEQTAAIEKEAKEARDKATESLEKAKAKALEQETKKQNEESTKEEQN